MHSIVNFHDPMVIITPLSKLAMDWGRVGGEPPPAMHSELMQCFDQRKKTKE